MLETFDRLNPGAVFRGHWRGLRNRTGRTMWPCRLSAPHQREEAGSTASRRSWSVESASQARRGPLVRETFAITTMPNAAAHAGEL